RHLTRVAPVGARRPQRTPAARVPDVRDPRRSPRCETASEEPQAARRAAGGWHRQQAAGRAAARACEEDLLPAGRPRGKAVEGAVGPPRERARVRAVRLRNPDRRRAALAAEARVLRARVDDTGTVRREPRLPPFGPDLGQPAEA